MSKSDVTTIDFNSIDVRSIKYLPSSFDGDIIFVSPPLPMGVPRAYGCSMDNMDKICDAHPWCTTKTTNIQNNFRFSFRQSCVGHLRCPNEYYNYMFCNGGVHNNNEWKGSTFISLYVENVTSRNEQ